MRYADAFERMDQLHSSTHKLLEQYTNVAHRGPPQLLKKVLLALELRWKLEDLVLIPALQDVQGVTRGCTGGTERELDALRDLAALAKDAGLGAEPQRLLLGAVETLAALRTERVSRALTSAQRAALVDARALGREMDQLLGRWHTEVRRTGEIEDEDLDPVGLPPR